MEKIYSIGICSIGIYLFHWNNGSLVFTVYIYSIVCMFLLNYSNGINTYLFCIVHIFVPYIFIPCLYICSAYICSVYIYCMFIKHGINIYGTNICIMFIPFPMPLHAYGVATISRLLKIIDLFCRISSLL